METIHLPVTTMSDSSLIDSMQTIMGTEHTKQFLDTVSTQTSRETVWDTMIDLFGHHDGTVYTAKLMDSFWKITDSHGQSLLMETALTNGLPTTANDTVWPKLMSFLDTIYDYDNL
jgi:hypothetical protein